MLESASWGWGGLPGPGGEGVSVWFVSAWSWGGLPGPGGCLPRSGGLPGPRGVCLVPGGSA